MKTCLAITLAATVLAPSALFAIEVNDRVGVTRDGAGLRVRNAPSTGTILGQRNPGNEGVVIGGPTTAGGLVWHEIDWAGTTFPTGWSAIGSAAGVRWILPLPGEGAYPDTTDQTGLIVWTYRVQTHTDGNQLKVRPSAGDVTQEAAAPRSVGDLGWTRDTPSLQATFGGSVWWDVQWDSDGARGWSVDSAVGNNSEVPIGGGLYLIKRATVQFNPTFNAPASGAAGAAISVAAVVVVRGEAQSVKARWAVGDNVVSTTPVTLNIGANTLPATVTLPNVPGPVNVELTLWVDTDNDDFLDLNEVPISNGFAYITVLGGGPTTPGDTDNSGCVDDADLTNMILDFAAAGGANGATDVNNDGVVDDADLTELILNFGAGC